MSKKSVTFNIKQVNVHVCNSTLEEIDQPQQKGALDGLLERLSQVDKSIKSRFAQTLRFIDNTGPRVKNDQDYRVIVHAILNKQDDVILETPEATAFLKELQEKGWFKDKMSTEPKKEKEPAPATAQANSL